MSFPFEKGEIPRQPARRPFPTLGPTPTLSGPRVPPPVGEIGCPGKVTERILVGIRNISTSIHP